jgi:hypothetical protein
MEAEAVLLFEVGQCLSSDAPEPRFRRERPRPNPGTVITETIETVDNDVQSFCPGFLPA